MTRVFLAAGVAALAIAAPAGAGPHGGGGGPHGGGGGQHGGGGQPAFVMRGGGGGPHGGGGGGGRHGGGFAAPRMQMQAQRQQRAPRMAMPHMQRAQRFSAPRMQHAQRFAAQRPQHGGRAQMHAQRQQRAHVQRMQTRMAGRQRVHGQRMQAQNRQAFHGRRMQAQNRQQLRAQHMQAQNRQQLRANRMQAQNLRGQRAQVQNRMAMNQQLQTNRGVQFRNQAVARQQLQAFAMNNRGRGFGVGGCPPGLANKGCTPPGLASNGIGALSVGDRVAAIRTLGDARFAPVDFVTNRQILDPFVADALVGVPIATAAGFGAFEPFPTGLSYLYPPTPAYYYEYGNGYAYQIDRSSLLIDALIPLLAGGFLPGSYLPQAYMSSYVPSYYGFNSFYPASYGGYGYGYPNLCNRYAYGVVYQVDCYSGLVQNVIPLYAGGYGVGQLLPSSYAYYNVPNQYRSLYYDTADYNYWYAPGAIYQYDPRSSLITSVAALLSPGFTVGQPLPAGYDVYNVPYAYRATYYDTPNAWYRYSDGYIYQVDPGTQLVSAIVASVLT